MNCTNMKGMYNLWINEILFKQLYPRPEIINAYLCLQHWFNNIYDKTPNKNIDDKHKDKYIHPYKSY